MAGVSAGDKPAAEKPVRVTFDLAPELFRMVREAATEHERTVSQEMRLLIRRHYMEGSAKAAA